MNASLVHEDSSREEVRRGIDTSQVWVCVEGRGGVEIGVDVPDMVVMVVVVAVGLGGRTKELTWQMINDKHAAMK